MRVKASTHYLIVLSALFGAASACGEPTDRIVLAEVTVAPGLKEGSQVIFRGLEIGRVERITLAHSGVQLALRVRSDAPLRSDDRAAVRPFGLFGDAAVEIIPGPESASLLGDSATLAAVPPDTLAPVREAAAQEVAKGIIAPLFQRDSTSAPGPDAPISRP